MNGCDKTKKPRPRRESTALSLSSYAKQSTVGVDVIHRLLHGRDIFCLLVWNLGLEFFFEGHYQLHCIKGISAKIIDKGSIAGYFVFART